MQEGQPARLEHRPGCCRGGPGLTRQLSGTEASGGGNVQSPPDQPRLRVPPLSQASALSVCCFHLPGMTFLSPTSRISLQRRLSTHPSPSLPRAAATFQVQLCVELIHSRMSFPPRPRPLWGRDCSAYFFLDSTVLVLIESLQLTSAGCWHFTRCREYWKCLDMYLPYMPPQALTPNPTLNGLTNMGVSIP